MSNDLYREEILEHYQNPQNFGKIKNFNASSRQTNPFCGDEIEMFIKFDEKSRCKAATPGGCIREIGFLGKGCAVCIAATSILTEYAKNKTKKQLTKFTEKDMLSLLGIEVSEARKKCALLGLAVLKDCLESQKSKVKGQNFNSKLKS